MATQKERRILILDTSIFVHDPNCIEGFPNDILMISPWMIDELDHLKRSEGERGEHALQALRNIHEYSVGGFARDVTMKSGGILAAENVVELPPGIEPNATNKNIFLAKRLMKESSGHAVVIISKDISRRIKASMWGVRSGDYEGEGTIHDPYAIFPGCSEIRLVNQIPMNQLHRNGSIRSDMVRIVSDFDTCMLIPNQCVRFTFEDKETLAVYKHSTQGFRLVPKPKMNGNGKAASIGVAPKNCEQAFAYSLLCDPEIKLVALVGSAGSGKTLMSLLAAKDHLKTEFERGAQSSPDPRSSTVCNQIIVFRPNVEMGRPLGFLPGDLPEKFEPWMYPILDNLDLIFHDPDMRSRGEKRADPVADFLDSGVIEISPINHVRGRSLHGKFIIIDEAQNLTRHEIRTLITRTGKGSKVILTGDISQIDDPYLDQTSNGLSHVISQFIGQEIFGYTIMKRGEERSLLAKLASDLL